MPLSMEQSKLAKGRNNLMCEIQRAQTGMRNSGLELLALPACLVKASVGMEAPGALILGWAGHLSLWKLFHYTLFGLQERPRQEPPPQSGIRMLT